MKSPIALDILLNEILLKLKKKIIGLSRFSVQSIATTVDPHDIGNVFEPEFFTFDDLETYFLDKPT